MYSSFPSPSTSHISLPNPNKKFFLNPHVRLILYHFDMKHTTLYLQFESAWKSIKMGSKWSKVLFSIAKRLHIRMPWELWRL